MTVPDCRPDTTPRLKEIKDFDAALPKLLDAARDKDPFLPQLVRQALWQIHHFHCPIGRRLGDAWVFVAAMKLESPNKLRSSWRVATADRARWEKQLQNCVLQAVGVSSWTFLEQLGRRPVTETKTTLQVIRLVPSTREFIRDDDNLGSARKGATDALKRTGLLKEDRREWLHALPTYQDVAPNGRALTVFFLWPSEVDLFTVPSTRQESPRHV